MSTSATAASQDLDLDPDEQLDVRGVAAEMDVHPETVRRLIRGKRLRAMQAGTNGYRIQRRWLEEYRQSTITMA
ncbi:helix-turn-helix domain-containing protein [Mycobacteroides abscessus subsp. abscessus]|uniref:helix-turn-helix domain-containing protein n=1 Tax=Mycobacteroides abscessus TaxID=36809 RepID=UPI0039EECC24